MNPEQDERRGKPSASGMARIHFCPGSENLIRSIPPEQLPQDSTDVAESGTRVHAALQTGDASDLDMTEVEIAERLKTLEVEAFNRWWEEVIKPSDYAGNSANLQVLRESRLWIRDQDSLDELASAKPDVVYHIGNFALCLDFKSGFLPATAAQKNHQLKTQAIAVWCETMCDNIRVVVAQHRFTSMVTAADYDLDALYNASAELRHDLWKSNQPDAPRVPGAWCDYCPAKAHCHEAGIYSLMAVKVAAPVLQYMAKKAEVELAVSQLTPEQLAFIEKRRGISEKIFEAVKTRLKKLPAEELTRLGFELMDGRPQMEVRDAGAIIAWLITERLLSDDEVMDCFKLLNGNLEELVLPRIVADPARKITNQKDAKAFLRGKLSENNWINYEASRTEGSLKEL